MAVRIYFDESHNPISPTFVLATRSCERIGVIPAEDIAFTDSLTGASELLFKVNKYQDFGDCEYKEVKYWDSIVDFKLVWCPEWDVWFSISVETEDSDALVKTVSGTAVCEAELSQVNLYNVEINTDDDIARSDYKDPSVLYNPENTKASILHRILSKVPHYAIKHVDSSLAKMQRSFSFDDKSIYDCLQTVADEIHCLFVFDSGTNDKGRVARTISVYDLEYNCLDCGYRGEFSGDCPNCGSGNIVTGYGENTTVYISKDNLANTITYSTDVDSVKNCFKLEAGDDDITAAVSNINPNGSSYLWYISDELKQDMSKDLVSKLDEYDTDYKKYQNDYTINLGSDIITSYNSIVDKYQSLAKILEKELGRINTSIKGYSALILAYYNSIDLELFLTSELMPTQKMDLSTSAENECARIENSFPSSLAVQKLDNLSESSATSAALSMAKSIVVSGFQVRASGTLSDDKQWSGTFTITSYSDSDDTFTTNTLTAKMTDDYETYVKQKIDHVLNNDTKNDASNISQLFKLDLEDFKEQIQKYCLRSLESFKNACQSCIDILISQGVADSKNSLYESIYVTYLNKNTALEQEISTKESELATIVSKKNSDNAIISDGVQTLIEKEVSKIQEYLDFERYLGTDLWYELLTYRRDETYSNKNYTSDGLNSAEIINKANDFISSAKKEIYKSATLQHSIKADINNLLMIKEFSAITDFFECGNWIHLNIDGHVYRLRLVKYKIDDFNGDGGIDVEFSDVYRVVSGESDIQDILKSAQSMSTSYGYVQKQAKQGTTAHKVLDDWVDKGLSLTKMKIIDNADNQNVTWDSHGLLCKEYLPSADEYDDRQLKIINRGLYLTDDNWKTSKTGIGDFTYYDPVTKKMVEAYGVIADTLVGSLVLAEDVGVYNEDISLSMNKNGFEMTADVQSGKTNKIFKINRRETDADGKDTTTPLLYLDDSGQLVIDGSVKIGSSNSSIGSVSDQVNNISNSKMYRVETVVTGSTIFNARGQTAQIECHVYSWDSEITDTLDASKFSWHRYSTDSESDNDWDSQHQGLKSITVSTEDVYQNASFSCDVTI